MNEADPYSPHVGPDGNWILRIEDLRGRKFSNLTPIIPLMGFSKSGKPYPMWICKCDCGNVTNVVTSALRSGNTKGCGCLAGGVRKGGGRINSGQTKSRTYNIWGHIRSRCNNPKHAKWKHYGGRGIRVCERWKSYANFLSDMGTSPAGMWIDRKDNNGNYEPGNCRWSTPTEQQRNKRNNRILSIGGQLKCLAEWSDISGIPQKRITARLKRGWTHEKSVFMPIPILPKTP